MSRSTVTEQMYDCTPAGVLVPSGSTTNVRSFSNTSVTAAKLEGLELLQLFRKQRLNPDRSTSLIRLIDGTTRFSDALLMANDHEQSYADLFCALQVSRIVAAVNAVRDDAALPRVLGELLDGDMNLLARSQSKAKDTLWELELLRIMRTNGIHAVLDEPDLLLAGTTDEIGVACKKLYSEANFSKVISVAVKQIRRSLKMGLVAVNIDDLLPADAVLKADSEAVASQMINTRISDFMVRQEHYLRRYLEPGRAVAILVSCATLADLKHNEPRFCSFRQTVAWHIPSTALEIDAEFNAILSAFVSGRTHL
jgi:hypothetical protein